MGLERRPTPPRGAAAVRDPCHRVGRPPKWGGTAPCPDPTVRSVLGKIKKKNYNLLTFARGAVPDVAVFGGPGLEKIDFPKISRNRWGIEGNVRRPQLSYSGPSIRRYSPRGPPAHPARDIADFHVLAPSIPFGPQWTWRGRKNRFPQSISKPVGNQREGMGDQI